MIQRIKNKARQRQHAVSKLQATSYGSTLRSRTQGRGTVPSSSTVLSSLPKGSPSRNKLQAPRGVTIIELIIVVTIVGILLSAGSAYYRDQQRHQQLEAQSQILTSVLRQVQLFAYTGKLNGSSRPGSHGVHFTTATNYFIFADMAAGGTLLEYDAGDTVIEQFTLPGSVQLDKVLGSGALTSIGGLDIVFAIPHGPVYVDAVTPSPDQRIRITDTVLGITKDVIVNGISGQVEIE